MKADFSRLNFNLDKQYTRVLQQQGRVSLDADWNEHVTIQAGLDRKRLIDVIGDCGVPHGNPGFQIVPAKDGSDLRILSGVIYVNGLRVELDNETTYSSQPFFPDPPTLATPPEGREQIDLVYLCVRERHITYLEDDEIREVALGGPDTTTRVQTTWQVSVQSDVSLDRCEQDFGDLMPSEVGGGQLTTTPAATSVDDDPCITPADSGYRGLENRLYRVEIHKSGTIGTASIKWSRYNGAVAFNVVPNSINDTTRTLRLTRLGWDQVRTLKQGSWIEIVSENDELNGVPGEIVQIDDHAGAVDDAQRQITLKNDPAYVTALGRYKLQSKVKVRLWNGDAQAEITLSDFIDPVDTKRTIPILLEDGIQIALSVAQSSDKFRGGDYWTIKARSIEGTFDMLSDEPPHGPPHYCCKLALIHWGGYDFTAKPRIFWEQGFFSEGPKDRQWDVRYWVDTTQVDINALVLYLREAFGRGGAPQELYTFLDLENRTNAELRQYAETFLYADGTTIICKNPKQDRGSGIEMGALLDAWFITLTGPALIDCRPQFPPTTDLLNLFYVSGDGQEALPGRELSRPLVVRANWGEYPVAGVPIRFELNPLELLPSGGETLKAGIHKGNSLIIFTDAQGFAQVRWQLPSTRKRWGRQVIAYIDAPDGDRQHLQVRFNANLSLAEEVSYQPPIDCSNLEGARIATVADALDALCSISAEDVTYTPPDDCPTLERDTIESVADALDALCHTSGEADPGFHITDVYWKSGEEAVQNGAEAELAKFLEGICIVCDEIPEPSSVIPEVYYIQLEIPRSDEGAPPLNVNYTIPGKVSSKYQTICWQPLPNAKMWLRDELPKLLRHNPHLVDSSSEEEAPADIEYEPILARLTVKGSFIWQQGSPEIYLDGDVTGTAPNTTPHNLNLPSGDRRRGGDFEMWFRLKSSPPAQPTGTLGWLIDGVTFPETLDPIYITESQDITVINLLFAGLVRLGKGQEVVPDLASEWEVGEEGTLYTFTLRENLRFSDGLPLTAGDVQNSLKRAMSTGFSGPIYLANIKDIEIVNVQTLKIRLAQRSRFFLYQLTTPPAKIVHKGLIESGNDLGLAAANITSGAFFLSDDSKPTLYLNNNPFYWSQAGIETITAVYIDELLAAVLEYLSSEEFHIIGSMQTGLPQSVEQENDFTTSEQRCGLRYLSLIHKAEDDGNPVNISINDPRFGEAMSYAIDREQLAETINEGALRADRILPPCMQQIPNPDTYSYDPERSKSLLDEMGLVDSDGDGLRETDSGEPFVLELIYASEGNIVNDHVIEEIVYFMAEIGIAIEPIKIGNLREFRNILQLIAINPSDPRIVNFNMYYSFWQMDYPDPQNVLSQQLHTVTAPQHYHNNGHYSNEDFDSEVDDGDKLYQGFETHYSTAETVALEQGAWIPLFYPQPRALIRPGVGGISLTGQGIVVDDFSALTAPE